MFGLAELYNAVTRKNVLTDGIHKDGKNINVSLVFWSEDNLARFQSQVIDLISVVTGHKRPNIGVDESTVPHEPVLRDERTECIFIADTVTLNRVFKYQYQHDRTANDPDNSAECDGFSDMMSLNSVSVSAVVNIQDPEVRCQMIEDPCSDYWESMSPEAAHIKDSAKCSKVDKKDPNNFIYMSRFLHCYFDGLNANPPKFPAIKIHYIGHDSSPVSRIDDEHILGLKPRYRVVVHIIFWDAVVRKYAMAFLRGNGRDIDELTYELNLYFQNAEKAAIFLKWKEEQTERAWCAWRLNIPATEVAIELKIGQEGEIDT